MSDAPERICIDPMTPADGWWEAGTYDVDFPQYVLASTADRDRVDDPIRDVPGIEWTGGTPKHPLAKAIVGLLSRREPLGRDMQCNLAVEFDRLHEIEAAADRDRRERDRLLGLGKGIIELATYAYEPAQLQNQIARGDLCPVAKDRLDDLRAAISEIEGGEG